MIMWQSTSLRIFGIEMRLWVPWIFQLKRRDNYETIKCRTESEQTGTVP
jgi:hypothetical protein